MAQTVTIIEDVNGQTVTRQRDVATSSFQVKVDGQLYEPAVVTNVEMELDPDSATPTDQCGNIERQRSTESGWLIRVKGIVTMNDTRTGNLSVQLLRDVIGQMDELKVRSDIYSGTIVISNIIITDSSDLVSINTRSSSGEEDAYEFQLQLGEKENQQ